MGEGVSACQALSSKWLWKQAQASSQGLHWGGRQAGKKTSRGGVGTRAEKGGPGGRRDRAEDLMGTAQAKQGPGACKNRGPPERFTSRG